MTVLGTIASHELKNDAVDPLYIDNLADAVRYACSADLTGLKVVVSETNRVIVYDCYKWKSEFTAILSLIRPRASISFSSSSNSMSKFQIIVEEPHDHVQWWRIAAVCCVIISCVMHVMVTALTISNKQEAEL